MAGRRLILGFMSGTSGDGVDVAVTEIAGRGMETSAKLIRHHALPYDAELRRLLFAIRGEGKTSLADLAALGRQISLTYARAANEAMSLAGISPSDVAAIAAHGQTLYHSPPDTIQWLDAALLAAETGIAVVSDFRRADCAAGGQGAPLVPLADYILYRDSAKTRILINLGGIANLTLLRAGGSIDDVIAFDTGPANCVSDWLCRENDPAGPGYDRNAGRAMAGFPHRQTVEAAARSSYALAPPPKSTDGPAMIRLFETACREASFSGSIDDQIATAGQVSTRLIGDAIDRLLGDDRRSAIECLVSGGGTQNPFLLHELINVLAPKGATVRALDPMHAQAKEAIAFAILAAFTLDGEPSNVPSVTGARHRVVLGSITPKPR